MPPSERRCRHCGTPFTSGSAVQVYCSGRCQYKQKLVRTATAARADRPDKGGDHATEMRQQPQRPRWALEWHPEVILRPVRLAPPQRDERGCALPFRDDLNAVADRGSPGRLA